MADQKTIAKTDWTNYYSRVASYTKITRKISINKILRVFTQHLNSGTAQICEIGGGNSFILCDILNMLKVESYHVLDSNALGLQLLRERITDLPVTLEQGNVLDLYSGGQQYDLVFSVGLIEHFNIDDTKKAIESHFHRCRPGGYVFISFPTPTFLYRTIRKSAELLRVWKFPDERPLKFAEVIHSVKAFGNIEHQSINWLIGLTQGYILVKKH